MGAPSSKKLERLAEEFQVLEKIDRASFQRTARILQSVWRCEQGYPVGEHNGRALGSNLGMPWAKETLENYLSDTIKDVVRSIVTNKSKLEGRLFSEPRIFNNLLSSQPLCFNLFGELSKDLLLATNVMKEILPDRVLEVKAIDFEYSPGRGKPKYTGDRSAFDVFISFLTPNGGEGFVGIEVKYHETLLGSSAAHRTRYDDVANKMSCFKSECRKMLSEQPLQQIWRDHLLAGSLLDADNYEDGLFVFLYPSGNDYCANAVDQYRQCLNDSKTFLPLCLEDIVTTVKSHTKNEWIDLFHDRYLNVNKLDVM